MRRTPFLNVLYLCFMTLILLSAIFTIWGAGRRTVDYSFNDKNVEDWSRDWLIKEDEADWTKANLPLKLQSRYGASIQISKYLPVVLHDYNCIMIESKRQDIVVYIDGEERASYTDNGQRIGNSLPYSYVFVPIRSSDVAKEVRVDITSDTYYSGNISSVFIGNEMSLMLRLIKSNVIWLALIVIIFIFGDICIICYAIYRKMFVDNTQFFHLFWFALFTAIWCLAQIKIRQIFIGDIVLMESLGHCAFLLIPIPIIMVVNWATQNRHAVFYEICMILSMVNFLTQNVLHTRCNIDYFEMQNVTQVFILILLIVSIALCSKDINNGLYKDSQHVMIGLLGQLDGIIAEAILVSTNIKYTLGSCYLLGALMFLLSIMLGTFMSLKREQEAKRDAVVSNQAKTRFLATMSHEIRTPINVVMGMNEMIRRDTTEPVILDYSNNIAEAGKSLLSLVNDVLDFSKIEAGKMDILCVEYRMKTLLNDLIIMAEGRIADKDIKLVCDIDEKIPKKLFGDEVRIKQVVTNLLTNAVKYTEKGKIIFTVKEESRHGNDIQLKFSVKDTGMGIKPEDIKKLGGNAFTRVDEKRNRNIEGTGLGLAITCQLLSLMGSKLDIESEYGKGSEFSFVIRQSIIDGTPMGSISVKEHDEVQDKRKINSFKAPKARILAVDDTKTNLVVIKGLLKPYCMMIDTAASGAECLEKCAKNRYDLILMDHMMPEMDGIETLEQLLTKQLIDESVKVVALTANAISGAEQMYLSHGFNGYLTKPINVAELDNSMRTYLPDELIEDAD